MLKLVGICIILLGCTGTGYSIVRERKQEIANCEQWERILSIMENEIAFQKSSIHEICYRISRHNTVGRRDRQFFQVLADELEENRGQTLGNIWKCELMQYMKNIRLPEDIKNELYELGEKLCYEDEQMQRKVIHILNDEMRKVRTNQMKEDEKRNKVTICMGIMTGLLITIILF